MSSPRTSRRAGLGNLPRPESVVDDLIVPAAPPADDPQGREEPPKRTQARRTTTKAVRGGGEPISTFLVHFPKDMHRDVKVAAVMGSTTMHDFVLEAVRERLRTHGTR